MINNEMDFGRVPDPRDTHLAEYFDRKWSSAVLSHSEVHRQYSNVSRPMNLLGTIGSDANDLLRKGQRIIVQDVLTQLRSEAGEKLVAIKRERRTETVISSQEPTMLSSPKYLKVFELELTRDRCPKDCFVRGMAYG